MFALVHHEYGGPDVLEVGEVPEPHAGAGQVRIRVRAASVNAWDVKVRSGRMKDVIRPTFPVVPGLDASGVVDEVGAGVVGMQVGDEVFGLGSATTAELALLDGWARKPASLPWADAAACALASETAQRGLEDLRVGEGTVLLVEGASGGVGSAAVQLARALGATVIGTSSERNADYVRSLGAHHTTYGPGIGDRVAALGVGSVTAVLDTAGSGSVAELVELVDEPTQVVSVADFDAPELGARAVRDGPRAMDALETVVRLHAEGRYRVEVERVVPLEDAAAAHRLSEAGHVRGKVVIAVTPA
ncbi:MAG TPA: NADP-dependent oxidoreductase [Intrasporangium sp.]|uniref:NADP-dependent oxidoreductase n=1 Tax=Intrasporangium sp. TaxID=1925024 RepID=UPI002B487A22|nr:NADP-dependent oxidoreductase [Intrasporangium sp.]HKX66293.1 NADP-dependent oxidoreductase [Intrasporangium sp.]